MGINNATYCSPEKMIEQILGLKLYFTEISNLQDYSSSPKLRADNIIDNKRTNLFVSHWKKLNIKLMLNDNIEKEHLNYRGLHLGMSGATKLSENLMKGIQS